MATFEAKPKRMDEIDYYLNELNASDNEKINITKAQIKGIINSLKNSVNELKVEIEFLLEDIIYYIVGCDDYINDDLKSIISKKYELQSKYFVLKHKDEMKGGESNE